MLSEHRLLELAVKNRLPAIYHNGSSMLKPAGL